MRVSAAETRIEANELKELSDPGRPLVARRAVDTQRLGENLAHRLARVETRIGVLEDHLRAAAVNPHLRAVQLEQLVPGNAH
jgi:hypothetical protein